MLRQAQHERKMVVTANTAPIALSTVEGCAQSPRSNLCSWFVVVLVQISRSRFTDTITRHARLASEIFLSGLQTEFNNC
jgi:hypothetical protein